MTWIEKYEVPKSKGDGNWIVSKSDTEQWGCSCPVWKFKRQECKHIRAVKDGTFENKNERIPKILLANVEQVSKEEETILLPLMPFGDTHFEATLCYDLYAAGAPWWWVRKRYRLARENNKEAITNYVRIHGRKTYGPWNGKTKRHDGFKITHLSPLPDLPKFKETAEDYSQRTGYPIDFARELLPSTPKRL